MFVINLIFYNRYQKIRPFNFLCNQSRISICWQKSTFFFYQFWQKRKTEGKLLCTNLRKMSHSLDVSASFFLIPLGLIMKHSRWELHSLWRVSKLLLIFPLLWAMSTFYEKRMVRWRYVSELRHFSDQRFLFIPFKKKSFSPFELPVYLYSDSIAAIWVQTCRTWVSFQSISG